MKIITPELKELSDPPISAIFMAVVDPHYIGSLELEGNMLAQLEFTEAVDYLRGSELDAADVRHITCQTEEADRLMIECIGEALRRHDNPGILGKLVRRFG